MAQYYIYPIALLIILAILFFPIKFIVIKIVEKQKAKQRIVDNYKNSIKAIERMAFANRMKLANLLKARQKSTMKVSNGLTDIAADLKSQLNELK